jgi:hypothetical protein
MGLFSNIETESSTKGGYWFVPGNYRVRIKRTFVKETRGGSDAVIIETEILESNIPEIRPVGSAPSQVIMMNKDAAKGNVADFLRAAFSSAACMAGEPTTPEEVPLNEELANNAFGEDSPLPGVELNVEAFNIKTKANTDFTKIMWTVPDDIAKSAAA